MGTIISVALQKGGCGKTTSVETIGGILGKLGYKVLLLDMDSQCNTTFISGIQEYEHSILDVFSNTCDIHQAIYDCDLYSLIPGDEKMSNFESIEEIDFTMLQSLLSPIKSVYDFIIIDTPPALGNTLKSCLVASDQVLIPTEAKPLTIKGFDELLDTISHIQKVHNRPNILGVFLVKHSQRSILNREMQSLIEDFCDENNIKLLGSIREGIAVAESQAMQLPLILCKPKSKPCLDYIELTNTILKRLGV